MANNSDRYIKQSISFSTPIYSGQSNAPSQYSDLQRQYQAGITRKFIAERAYLSSDYVAATVQGLTENFETYMPIKCRMADILRPSADITKKMDDFKEVLFADEKISYVPIGAKLVAMGSTWLVINPSNIGAAATSTVVVRCNTSYNTYDSYGNVVTEPIYVEKSNMLGNDNQKGLNLILMDGYFNIICQLNQNTMKLGQNQRLILGTKAYHITGFTDFIQEFTGDRQSVHLLNFTARLEEPTELDDISENFIANGKAYTFAATLSQIPELKEGESVSIEPHFLINGEEVFPTEDMSLEWSFESSDSSIAIIGEDYYTTEFELGGNTNKFVSEPYSLVQFPRIYGRLCTYGGWDEYPYFTDAPNPILQIVVNGGQVLNIPQDLAFYGYSEENYIYLDGSRTYYHQGARWSYDFNGDDLEPGETIIDSVYDAGNVVRLANPIITDITENFDLSVTYANVSRIDTISKYTEESLEAVFEESGRDYTGGQIYFYEGNVLVNVKSELDSNVLQTISSGDVVVTATLQQNPSVTASQSVHVYEDSFEPYVLFEGVTDRRIKQYQSSTYTAKFYGGDSAVTWSFAGADPSDYETFVNGNELTVRCLSSSDVPLTITASVGEYSASISVTLEGY